MLTDTFAAVTSNLHAIKNPGTWKYKPNLDCLLIFTFHEGCDPNESWCSDKKRPLPSSLVVIIPWMAVVVSCLNIMKQQYLDWEISKQKLLQKVHEFWTKTDIMNEDWEMIMGWGFSYMPMKNLLIGAGSLIMKSTYSWPRPLNLLNKPNINNDGERPNECQIIWIIAYNSVSN